MDEKNREALLAAYDVVTKARERDETIKALVNELQKVLNGRTYLDVMSALKTLVLLHEQLFEEKLSPGASDAAYRGCAIGFDQVASELSALVDKTDLLRGAEGRLWN